MLPAFVFGSMIVASIATYLAIGHHIKWHRRLRDLEGKIVLVAKGMKNGGIVFLNDVEVSPSQGQIDKGLSDLIESYRAALRMVALPPHWPRGGRRLKKLLAQMDKGIKELRKRHLLPSGAVL